MKELRETPVKGSRLPRYDCQCGAKHIKVTGENGKEYLIRIFPTEDVDGRIEDSLS